MKTIIIDYNNISMSRLFSKDVMEKTGYDVENINYQMWKFKVFSDIYYYINKFNVDEVIIAIDSTPSWRKIYFSRYKEKRANQRNNFNIDWNEYNNISSNFLLEIKKHMPFKIIKVDKCEGDDIIGVLSHYKPNDNITIISSDSDFLQLCRKNLKVFSIMKQKEISHPDPEMFLKESSLIGQQKDNIMNIMTPLDYPIELRKPSFGKKRAEKVLIDGIESLDKTVKYKRKYIDSEGKPKVYESEINLLERYKFNRNLMDLTKVPNVLKKNIIDKYENYMYPEPDNIQKFIHNYGWTKFTDNIVNVENKLFQLYKSQKRS